MNPVRRWRYSYMGVNVEGFERRQDAVIHLIEKYNLDPPYARLFVEHYWGI